MLGKLATLTIQNPVVVVNSQKKFMYWNTSAISPVMSPQLIYLQGGCESTSLLRWGFGHLFLASI
jgi:hypothetical protein